MKLPRKIKKKIPKNTPYCYSRFTCKYYKHIEGVEGYCKLIKYEVEDQMKSCGLSMGYNMK